MRIGIDYTAALRQGAGIGRYTRELVTALLSLPSPHRYTLFAATGGLSLATGDLRLNPPTGKLAVLPLSDEWLARLWHRARLPIPVELWTGRLDLFYSPDFVLPPTLPGTRTLLTVHDLSFLRYPDHFVPKLVAYLSRVVPRAVARADRVLADSQATRRDLRELLGVPAGKVEVLYSGVDARFAPQPAAGERERLQRRYALDERPYVLSVGTIQPRKNYARLIRTFAALPPGHQLLIAGGPGWLYQEVFDLAAQHADRVRILGFVDDADLPALYRSAALLVFPSLYEGFGLPVLEAMACGVPVVCSDASSLPEVAGDAALLVNPLDDDALVQAMRRALEDAPLRQERIARGLLQSARFRWPAAAEQLLNLFSTLLRT